MTAEVPDARLRPDGGSSGSTVLIVAPAGRGAVPAADLGAAVAAGWTEASPDVQVEVVIGSDGHRGLLEAVLAAHPDGQLVAVPAADGDAQSVVALTGSPDERTGWVEAGPALPQREHRDPAGASSYPTGQLVAGALDAGARRVVVGAGASPTGDGGAGLIAGLAGEPDSALAHGPAALRDLSGDDLAVIDRARERLAGQELVIAAALDGPLLGPAGDWATWGEARGVDPAQAQHLDLAVAHFVDLAGRRDPGAPDLLTGRAPRPERGFAAAAGGGIGYAASLLRAVVRPGADLVAQATGLATAVPRARLAVLVVEQVQWDDLLPGPLTWLGQAAQRHAIPTIVLCERSAIGRREAMSAGIHAVYPVTEVGPRARAVAAGDLPAALRQRAARVARTWRA